MSSRLSLLAFALLIAAVSFSQDKAIKMITDVTGMPGIGDKMKMEYTMFVKENGNMKIQVTGKEFSVTNSYIDNKVKIVRKEKGQSDLCAEGTIEEFNAANSKNTPKAEMKDVKVEQLNKTATIAGYECKSAIISYNTIGMMSMKIETTVWYTDQIKAGNTNYLKTNFDQQENDYTKALKELGTVLKTESKGFGGVSTISEIIEIKQQEFADSDIDIDLSSFKKVLDFEKYNKEVNEREAFKQRSQQNSNDQMRRNQKMMGY